MSEKPTEAEWKLGYDMNIIADPGFDTIFNVDVSTTTIPTMATLLRIVADHNACRLIPGDPGEAVKAARDAMTHTISEHRHTAHCGAYSRVEPGLFGDCDCGWEAMEGELRAALSLLPEPPK